MATPTTNAEYIEGPCSVVAINLFGISFCLVLFPLYGFTKKGKRKHALVLIALVEVFD